MVDAEEAARILGYASPRTISSYLARNVGYFPDPDDIEGPRETSCIVRLPLEIPLNGLALT